MDRLPVYAIVGSRPVKAVETPDGGVDVLAYDWETGEFVRNLDYLEDLLLGRRPEVEYVDKEEFERYVNELRTGNPTGS